MKKIVLRSAALLLLAALLSSCGASPSLIPTETAAPALETASETAEPIRERHPDYDYVVVIGLDGAGNAIRDVDSPRFDEIFADGAVTYGAQSVTPTISAQNWGSMLHGVLPAQHKLTNEIAASQTYPDDSKYPSIFRIAREQIPDADLVSFTRSPSINYGIIERGIGVRKISDTDDNLVEYASYYVSRHVPTLLFLHLEDPDIKGHAVGYWTEAYYETIRKADSQIGAVYDAYAEAGVLDRTLFLVVADHGGIGTKHGGTTPEEQNVVFAAAGHTVKPGIPGEMDNRAVAAIIARALDLVPPDTWTATVPEDLFYE